VARTSLLRCHYGSLFKEEKGKSRGCKASWPRMEFTGAYTQTLLTTNCKRPFFTIFHRSRKEADDVFLEIFTKQWADLAAAHTPGTSFSSLSFELMPSIMRFTPGKLVQRSCTEEEETNKHSVIICSERPIQQGALSSFVSFCKRCHWT